MLRIGLFSDVHANLPALEAVLEDMDATRLDRVYCLGDLVGYGPDPAGVVERVRALGISTVRGNYDDGIGNRRGQCGCYYATAQAKANGERSYAFTDGALDDVDHAWLAALPDNVRLEHEGVRVLLAHGSPRKSNEYLLPDRTDELLVRLARQADADVVCVGHVHVPYHRAIVEGDGTVHYVSSGSVGKPKDGDPRACWVEVLLGQLRHVLAEVSDDAAAGPAGSVDANVGLGVRIHRCGYDVEAVAAEILGKGLPPAFAEALRNA